MERVGFVLRVKPDKKEEYKEVHQRVWPELLNAMSQLGISNYSIFMRQDGTLFGYLEATDFKKAMAELAKNEANLRWQEAMKAYLATPIEMSKSEPLELLEEVFHMD